MGMKIIAEEEVRSRSRERSFSRNINNRRKNRSISNSRSRSGSRDSTNKDKIRCYKDMIILLKSALHLKKKER